MDLCGDHGCSTAEKEGEKEEGEYDDDDDDGDDDDGDDAEGDNIPHQIRGNVSGFSQIMLKVSAILYDDNDDECNNDVDTDIDDRDDN